MKLMPSAAHVAKEMIDVMQPLARFL